MVKLSWAEGSRCAVRIAGFGMMRAAPVPWGAPGLPGRRVVVRDDVTAEPPAHCRLVSGHDLFEMVAWSDCTASNFYVRRSDTGKVLRSVVDLKI